MSKHKYIFSRVRSALFALTLLASFTLSLGANPVSAAEEACAKQGTETSFKWSGGDGCTNTTELINTILKFLGSLVGLAVVGGIIYGGMLYATANGNSNKTQQAISVIVNAVIALLLFIFLFALVNFLVPGGLIG